MPTKRVWLGHASDRVQIDRIELDATAVVAEGTDLVFKINGKELPVENPHPVTDEDTAVAGDTAGVLTLLQAAGCGGRHQQQRDPGVCRTRSRNRVTRH